MNILAIDPGTTQSGWVMFDGSRVLLSGVIANEEMAAMVRAMHPGGGILPNADLLAIEKIEAMGMAVGKEVFETVHWSGRFYEAWRGTKVLRVTRRSVKLHLCGNMQAKDANIRQALIDLFEPTGGGATPQIGTKAKPGPLYGVSSHAWAALAVAVTAMHQQGMELAA